MWYRRTAISVIVTLALFAIGFTLIAVGQYVTGMWVLIAISVMWLAFTASRFVGRAVLRLRPGMVFMDGGVPCTVHMEGRVLKYRSYELRFAARDFAHGIVIYSSFDTRAKARQNSRFGTFIYNAHVDVMKTAEGKFVERHHELESKVYSLQ